jgi:hypothetical protein
VDVSTTLGLAPSESARPVNGTTTPKASKRIVRTCTPTLGSGLNGRRHLASDPASRTTARLTKLLWSYQSLQAEVLVYLRGVLDPVSIHPASRIAELAWIPTEAKPANKLRGKSKIR